MNGNATSRQVIKTITTTTVSDSTLAISIVDNTAKVLSSAAWPIAVVVIGHFFKSDIAALIARLRSFKALGFEASMDAFIQSSLPPIPANAIPEPIEPVAAPGVSGLEAILAAWRGVEEALNEAIVNTPGGSSQLSLRSKINRINAIQGVPTGLTDRVMGLFNIRNRIVHTADSNISDDSLRLYKENALSATRDLQSISRG